MGINKEARLRAAKVVGELDTFTDSQLKELAKALRLQVGRRGKGGIWQALTRDELLRTIRSQVGRGTFADTLNRFTDVAHTLSDYGGGGY